MTTTRRALLAALPALPASSVIGGLTAFAHIGSPKSPAPWWLVEPLTRGSSLEQGWTVVDLGPVVDGGAVLTLKGPDQPVTRVHLCLHDGNPRGYAYTELFDLIVMDQGRGVREMPPDLAAVLTQLSETICDNELRRGSAIGDIATMMTHAERVQAYGAGHLK